MIGSIDPWSLGGWLAMLIGAALSFLFSGLETGTYVVNKIRLDLRVEAGSGRARRLQSLLRQPNVPLGIVLIGNNLANYAISAGMVLVLTRRGVTHAEWWAMAILTPVVFILCEALPKNLFQRHAETLTYSFSGFLTFCRGLFRAIGLLGLTNGLVALMLKLARRRLGPYETPLAGGGPLGALLAEGQASGALTHAQSIMAERVINIGRLRLADVMVPLEKATLVEPGVTVEQLRPMLKSPGHARVGVYQGTRENIIGVINAAEAVLNPARTPREHMVEPHKLPAAMGVLEGLSQMRLRRTALAFVTDQAGRCIGLVTPKDLVEEVVGELDEL